MNITTLSGAPGKLAAESRWAVETHGLTKHFGANTAVNGVELLVPRGSAFGYLGPNGAGKTTLIRVLLGLTRADAGTMSLLGYPVPRHRDAALARVGAIVDEPRFHPHLTGLLGDPQLLLLDEPMNWLDPAGMAEMRDMILSMVAEGRTVVLSSHLLDEVERTCDAVAIVDHGSIIQQGPISELLAGARVALQVECSEPGRAHALLAGTTLGARTAAVPAALGLEITLPAGTGRDVIAEINRVLVAAGISVYRLQPVQTSLESWFLQVTSRVGDPE